MANLFRSVADAAPSVDVARSVFDLSHSNKLTFNEGDLIPILNMDVLPGDTFSLDTAVVARLSTPIRPVMDDAFLDVYYFFVPNRLLWSHWEEFVGENKDGVWSDDTDWQLPYVMSDDDSEDWRFYNSLEYLGYVGSVYGMSSTSEYAGSVDGIVFDGATCPVVGNVLSLNAYILVWNEWFRDQNCMNPQQTFVDAENGQECEVLLRAGSVQPDVGTGTDLGIRGYLLPVSKYHDYFTSVLPSPQKGDAVSFGFSGTASLVGDGDDAAFSISNPIVQYDQELTSNVGVPIGTHSRATSSSMVGLDSESWDTFRSVVALGGRVDTSYITSHYSVDLTNASAVTINQLREAFATQSFLERQALGGTRYREIIFSHFGVQNGDSRMQIPEYLGGKRIPITTSQVAQTVADSDSPLGTLGAFSAAQDSDSSFTKTFTEFGKLIGVACVRVRHTYAQGIKRDHLRSDVYDYYWPEFDHIGEQPVYTSELFFSGTPKSPTAAKSDVFGFQEAHASYRYGVNEVHGLMRPDVDNNISYWNYTDLYSSAPTYSAGFIVEGNEPIDRTLAVTTDVSSACQVLADFYFHITAARPMSMYSTPANLMKG